MWDKDNVQECVVVRDRWSSGPRLAELCSCVPHVGGGDP